MLSKEEIKKINQEIDKCIDNIHFPIHDYKHDIKIDRSNVYLNDTKISEYFYGAVKRRILSLYLDKKIKDKICESEYKEISNYYKRPVDVVLYNKMTRKKIFGMYKFIARDILESNYMKTILFSLYFTELETFDSFYNFLMENIHMDELESLVMKKIYNDIGE